MRPFEAHRPDGYRDALLDRIVHRGYYAGAPNGVAQGNPPPLRYVYDEPVAAIAIGSRSDYPVVEVQGRGMTEPVLVAVGAPFVGRIESPIIVRWHRWYYDSAQVLAGGEQGVFVCGQEPGIQTAGLMGGDNVEPVVGAQGPMLELLVYRHVPPVFPVRAPFESSFDAATLAAGVDLRGKVLMFPVAGRRKVRMHLINAGAGASQPWNFDMVTCWARRAVYYPTTQGSSYLVTNNQSVSVELSSGLGTDAGGAAAPSTGCHILRLKPGVVGPMFAQVQAWD